MTNLVALSSWLVQAPDVPVALDETGLISRSDIRNRVAYWCQRLPAAPGQRWAVYHQDTIEFLALSLALWQLGCTVCVPGDNRPVTNERLQRRVAGFAGQYPKSLVPYTERCLTTAKLLRWRPLPADFPALEIFTSGSTGEPKPILKTFAQIEGELEALERLWPEQKQAVVVTTVTHQHLYGLTFRLFWPLCRGQVFERSNCQFAEDIFTRAQQHSRFVLVSTPSHLSRLNPAFDWQSLQPCCEGVLSSAAPLQRADSLQVSELLQAPVREIYGSSETGAVAWRVQNSETEVRWQPLPGVGCTLTQDSTLQVSAPHVQCGRQVLSDRVELAQDGSFLLQGRTDRIAKIEGKRISLVEVERVAEQQRLIKTAKALVLHGRRTELAIVAELTPEGERYLKTEKKRALVHQLRQAFSQHFEPVALPRRWRFVERMPYNPQGKITVDSLQAMFQQDEIKWPRVVSQTRADQAIELTLKIPGQLIYFSGHFAGNPILPGIVQVHWAVHYGRELLGVKGEFCRLEATKFQQVIFPEAEVNLLLEYSKEKQKLTFQYVSEKGGHSSGRICFN
ncbi:MAG: AMP-binding protein [Oceanospirillales bacterium]|nr:AMP-binding protein [Oceanospirillales bacterium]